MHHRVGAKHLADPGIERQVIVRRHQVGRVIAGLGVDVVAARRLDADDHIAEAVQRQREAPAVELARCIERIALRRPPALLDLGAHLPGQRVPEQLVVDEGQRLAALPPRPVGQPVRRPGLQPRHQRGAVRGRVRDPISGFPQRPQHPRHARRRVEPDAVRQPPIPVGVVRQHDGHAPLGHRLAPEPGPGRGQPRGEGDARALGPVGGDPALGRRVDPGLGLEADGAREDPPVHLRQRHVHGDVARREAGQALAPRLLGAAGEDHLQNGPPGRVERRPRMPLLRARLQRRHGEGRRVQHHGRRRFGEEPLQRRRRDGLLQGGHEDRQRVQPLLQQRPHQPVHRMQPRALHQRAVEDQRRNRRPLDPVRPHGGEVADARPRPVALPPAAGPRRRRRPLTVQGRPRPLARRSPLPPGIESGGGRARGEQHPPAIGQEIRRVLRPALDQIGPERLPVLLRHRRRPPQRLVRPVIARQRREGHARRAETRRELLQAIGPIPLAAQHARHHQTRARRRPLEVEVDRHRMRQVHQRRQPQARRVRHRAPRLGQRRELAVGRRDHHQIGRRLVEVDGLGPVRRGARLSQQQVHQPLLATACAPTSASSVSPRAPGSQA